MLGVFYERESAGVFGQYFENCLSSVVERLREVWRGKSNEEKASLRSLLPKRFQRALNYSARTYSANSVYPLLGCRAWACAHTIKPCAYVGVFRV